MASRSCLVSGSSSSSSSASTSCWGWLPSRCCCGWRASGKPSSPLRTASRNRKTRSRPSGSRSCQPPHREGRMSQLVLAALSAALAWSALIVYAMFGGADFGGGVVDLLAGWRLRQHGQQREWHRERQAIAQAMGPVWEANHVWLIFVLVVTWTAFPIVYAAVSTALFIPVTLALIGIVLRGAAFGFRSNYGLQVGLGVAWGHVFDAASVITPFLFGTVAGALASGSIRGYCSPLTRHAHYC